MKVMFSCLTHPFLFTATMEAKVIQQLFPKLISAVAPCVQDVSDHCFSKSLIDKTTHEKVLQSVLPVKDKARILVSTVQDTVARNPKSDSFNVFMNVLEEVLPSADVSLLKEAVTSSLSEVEHLSSQTPSDSDPSQLQQPISKPSSKGDFIHNRHPEWPEESDSVSVCSTSASDMPMESSYANESSATQTLSGYQMESNVEVSCSACAVTLSVS